MREYQKAGLGRNIFALSVEDKKCHELAVAEAKVIEDQCKKDVDAKRLQESFNTFRCIEGSGQFTIYFGCSRKFNEAISLMNKNRRCKVPIRDKRNFYVPRIYIAPTYECSSGLKGYWNKLKFSKNGKKELTVAEKMEEKVMSSSNDCVHAFSEASKIEQRRKWRKQMKLATDKTL